MSPPTTSMMGLFLQHHFEAVNRTETRYLPSSKEGESVPLDDTFLSFLGRKATIKGCSNGFLLCSFELEPPHISYCTCNPLTREYRVLPQQNKVRRYTAVAFSCNPLKGTSPCLLKNASFQVVLMTISKRHDQRLLKIQTFSSKTGKWIITMVKGDIPPLLVKPPKTEVVMIGEVIYWMYYTDQSLYAYDTTTKLLKRVEGPLWDDVNIKKWTSTLAQSEGNLYLARSSHGSTDLEIWILKKKSSGRGSEWVLCVKKRLLTVLNSNQPPGSTPLSLEDSSTYYGRRFSVKSIHPHDPTRILMVWRDSLYWYHLSTDKLEFLLRCKVPFVLTFTIPRDYFIYEQPVATIHPHANLFSRL